MTGFILSQILGGVALLLTCMSYFTDNKRRFFCSADSRQSFLCVVISCTRRFCRRHQHHYFNSTRFYTVFLWKKWKKLPCICIFDIFNGLSDCWQPVFAKRNWYSCRCCIWAFQFGNVCQRYGRNKNFDDFTKYNYCNLQPAEQYLYKCSAWHDWSIGSVFDSD